MKPGDLPISPDSFEGDIDQAALMGLIDGVLTPEPYQIRWDKRDDFRDPLDFGWIGEDRDGIWIRQHPFIALLRFGHLWRILDAFKLGGSEMQPNDYADLSAVEVEAKATLCAAFSRSLAAPSKDDK